MLSYQTIKQLSKIDLHRHLDGDVKTEVLYRLAEKDKIHLPVSSPEELEKYFAELRTENFVDLLQKGFGLVTSLMQSEENLYTVAYEEGRNLAEDGIVYAELRFAPQYHTGDSLYYGHQSKNKLSYQQIIKAVAEGCKAAEKDFSVSTKLIVCIGREVDAEKGREIVHAALACLDEVVAIDLACDEATYPPERHLRAFQETFDTPLGRTVHAGEFGTQRERNMWKALKRLRADRLGHAIPLAENKELLAYVKENKIGIESCPKSNKYIGLISKYTQLGIPQLLAEGILVSVNSDDPAMFGYTLTDTLCELAGEEKLTLADVMKLQQNALEMAFLDEEERKKIEKKMMGEK
ncbi:adenosine deaminase [Candidatus Woesearchaeota archaeon]|nr:adenosine deaminase [Candidatus Woesearchaeota archaeon]